MKRIILFFLLSVVITGAYAQDLSYEIIGGEVRKDKLTKRTFSTTLIGSDNEFMYFLHQPYSKVYGHVTGGFPNNHFISKLNKSTLNQSEKKEIVLDYEGRKRSFIGTTFLNDKIILFSSFENEKSKKVYLFVQTIDLETLELKGDLKMISEFDFSKGQYMRSEFQYELSPNGTRVLVYFSTSDSEGQNGKYVVHVFSNDFELIWKNESVELELNQGVFALQTFKVDEHGTVYFLGQNFKGKDYYSSLVKFKRRNSSSTRNFLFK